ncbi:MAG: alkene reductase [Thiohalomonadales bacterium]
MVNQENTEPSLFSRTQFGDLDITNRIVMAPLTRNRAAKGNVPQEMNVEYYKQRASAGLIITEATQISPQGVGYSGTPGIHSKEQIVGWQKVTAAVHQQNGKIFQQLWHVGRISHPSLQPAGEIPVAPSAIKPSGEAITLEGPQAYVEPHALSTAEIKDIVAQYGLAAKNAYAAGFDGIEIHAANGYLIDQFIRDGSNVRNDEYGGSLQNRTRFLIEVVQAALKTWPATRIGVRISPENGFNDMHDSNAETTFLYVAQKLAEFGLAYLHVLEGDMLGGTRKVDYRAIKNKFAGHYMANMGYTLARGNAAIANGDADSIAFGSLYIANPDLVERFKTGAELNTPDQSTFYGGDTHGYTDYPMLQKEAVAT